MADYEILVSGFDKIFQHFAQAPQAMRDTVVDFLQETATEQTHDIQVAYDAKVKSQSGQTRRTIQPYVNVAAGVKLSAGTRANPNLDRLHWLNDGTGLYGAKGQMIHITAKNKRALHFTWQGREYFRVSVNVKGIKPRRFIQTGITEFRSKLPANVEELENRLTQVARTIGWS